MKINQVKRQIILKVLRAIRGPLLEENGFLCCAADAAARRRIVFDYERDIFEQFIRERLEGCYTVGEWLREQGVEVKNATGPQKLDYRQRWVAAMIKEFSK